MTTKKQNAKKTNVKNETKEEYEIVEIPLYFENKFSSMEYFISICDCIHKHDMEYETVLFDVYTSPAGKTVGCTFTFLISPNEEINKLNNEIKGIINDANLQDLELGYDTNYEYGLYTFWK